MEEDNKHPTCDLCNEVSAYCECCSMCNQTSENCTCCDRCDQTQEDCDCCSRCEQTSSDCDCCNRCDNLRDDCDCCYECDNTADDCTCYTCNGCSDRTLHDNGCSECEICQRCLDRGRVWHYHCEGCDSAISESDWVCSECYHCEDCVRPANCDDCSSCTDCCTHEHEEEEEDIAPTTYPAIRDYSCRAYPASIPANPPSLEYLYLGVECEVEMMDGKNKNVAAQTIADTHSKEILLKKDGSLDNGFEMVTGKYSLAAHKDLWPRLCATALSVGCRSWKHETTGLHVHMSRDFFTVSQIGKLVVFLNCEANRRNITKLAGRKGNTYATFNSEKTYHDTTSCDRYEVLNLTNSKTVEVRIFKGTLKASRILACIEFCDAMARWVKTNVLADCDHWEEFWAYVKEHADIYSNLVAFFEPSANESEEEVLANAVGC